MRQRLQVSERPPYVTWNNVEQGFRRRREEADVEVCVEKDCRHVGAVEDVLQIVRGRALPIQRFLQLAIESVQFLVERLQFLLGGHQFLVRGLILLIDR